MLFEAFRSAVPHLAGRIRTAQFLGLIEERTRHFVGREFAFSAIDAHLADPTFASGYIVVSGNPGQGKTALMAALVSRRGWVHHFNIATDNVRSTRSFLSNVCAQLIVKYQLPYHELPPHADEDAGVLNALLDQARQRTDKPIVLVVDALDEAEAPPGAGANVLCLPRTLPLGVFFVVSMRPDKGVPMVADRKRPIDLQGDEQVMLDDARAYVRQFLEAHRGGLPSRLAEWCVADEEFVNAVAEASDGNFMYLSHVLEDMHAGRLASSTLANVHALPVGLDDYYRQHWSAMRQRAGERFARCHEPLLGVLAVARASLPLEQIVAWGRQVQAGANPVQLSEALDDWSGFVRREGAGADAQVRIYHASFRDFLATKVDATAYHAALLGDALGRLSGQGAHQPFAGLNAYMREHLLAHAVGAGRVDEVHRLLAHETADGGNAWYEMKAATGRVAEYRDDLALARQLAAAQAERAVANDKPTRAMGLAQRYALALASVNSLASGLPPEVLTMAARCALVPLADALALAQAVPQVRDQLRGLLALLPMMRGPERARVIDQVLDALPRIDQGISRAELLSSLAELLQPADEPLHDRLISVTFEFGEDGGHALELLAPVLQLDLVDPAVALLRCARAGWRPWPYATALAALADRLSPAKRTQLIERELEQLGNENTVSTLVAVAARRGEALPAWIERVLRDLDRCDYEELHAAQAAPLIPWVEPSVRERLIAEIPSLMAKASSGGSEASIAECYATEAPDLTIGVLLELAAREAKPFNCLSILCKLIPHAQGDACTSAIDMALDCMSKLADPYLAKDLCALAPQMTDAQACRALDLAQGLPSSPWRAVALASLVAARPGAARDAALTAALEAARQLFQTSLAQETASMGYLDRHALQRALGTLAPQVEGAAAGEVWRMARAILDGPWRTHGVMRALPHMGAEARAIHVESLLTLAAEKFEPPQRVEAVRALAKLPGLSRPYFRRLLRQAFGLPDPELRPVAVAAVVPCMPARHRDRALRAAFRAARSIQRESVRAEALSGVYEACSAALRRELAPAVMKAAEGFEDRELDAGLVALTLADLHETEKVEAWQHTCDRVWHESDSHKARSLLARCVPSSVLAATEASFWLTRLELDDDIKDALLLRRMEVGQFDAETLLDCQSHRDSVIAWAKLLEEALPLLSDPQHVRSVLGWIEEIDNPVSQQRLHASGLGRLAQLGQWEAALDEAPRVSRADLRVLLLVDIAEAASPARRPSIVQEAFVSALQSEGTDERFRAQCKLAPLLARHARESFMPLWASALDSWSRLSRLRLVHELFCYAPVVAALGGSKSVDEMVNAVEDVGRWWP